MTPHDDPSPRPSVQPRSGRRRFLALTAAGVFALAACGSSDDDASPATDASADAGTPDDTAVLEFSESVTVVGAPLAQLTDGPDPTIGTTAPEITGQQFDGSAITIGGAADGPTMLVFLAHWCPHCNDEIPEILELRDNGELPDGLEVMGISTAARPDGENYPPSQWIVDKNWDFPTLADTVDAEAFQTYGGSGFPYATVLDADGNVVARKSGSGSAEQIKDWLDAVLVTA